MLIHLREVFSSERVPPTHCRDHAYHHVAECVWTRDSSARTMHQLWPRGVALLVLPAAHKSPLDVPRKTKAPFVARRRKELPPAVPLRFGLHPTRCGAGRSRCAVTGAPVSAYCTFGAPSANRLPGDLRQTPLRGALSQRPLFSFSSLLPTPPVRRLYYTLFYHDYERKSTSLTAWANGTLPDRDQDTSQARCSPGGRRTRAPRAQIGQWRLHAPIPHPSSPAWASICRIACCAASDPQRRGDLLEGQQTALSAGASHHIAAQASPVPSLDVPRQRLGVQSPLGIEWRRDGWIHARDSH